MTPGSRATVRKNAARALITLDHAPGLLDRVYFSNRFPPEMKEGLFWVLLRNHVVVSNLRVLRDGGDDEVRELGGYGILANYTLDIVDGIRAMLRVFLSPPHSWREEGPEARRMVDDAFYAYDKAHGPVRRLAESVNRQMPGRARTSS